MERVYVYGMLTKVPMTLLRKYHTSSTTASPAGRTLMVEEIMLGSSSQTLSTVDHSMLNIYYYTDTHLQLFLLIKSFYNICKANKQSYNYDT